MSLRVVPKPASPENGTNTNGPFGGNLGTATTDASGKATFKWVVEGLTQGNFSTKASFAGTTGMSGSNDAGNLFVSKGITAFDLSTISCGAYKNEPGKGWCSVLLSLQRTIDSKILKRDIKLEITSGGKTTSRILAGSASSHSLPLLGASPWKIKLQFDGDAAYQASSAAKTYTRL